MRLPFRRPWEAGFEPRRFLLVAAGLLVGVAAASVVVALLEAPPLAMADASPVYLVAVVLVASRFGTWAGISTALASFVVYDFAFTEPRFSLVVADPREWFDLVLFLFLALAVGRLAALGSERADVATRRAAEAAALFSISRTLAIAPDLEAAGGDVAARLVRETGLERVWIATERAGRSTIVADSLAGEPLPGSPFTLTLIRTPGDTPARWVRSHGAGPAGGGPASRRRGIVRVRMEADGVIIGSVWAADRQPGAQPSREATRLLALAADQLALAIRRADLRREATDAEIARQGDALKSALLDAVSHDLRTPLASIRATAGTLSDPDIPVADDAARAAGLAIDLEAQRLDRLVRGVLDLSRIEAGALRPELEALDLRDVIEPVVDRLRSTLGERPISIELPDDLPPVRADPVLLDTVVGNLVENAARYAPPPAAVSVSAAVSRGRLRIAVDDAGPGVPTGTAGRLFEKFYRVDQAASGSRRGLGIGLAIVRGLVEAMGGSVVADRSALGGLRVVVELDVATGPPAEPDEVARTADAAAATTGSRVDRPAR